ncbi:hypothetical protein E2562_003946, partial [Oryza meyeriana var. granulata]
PRIALEETQAANQAPEPPVSLPPLSPVLELAAGRRKLWRGASSLLAMQYDGVSIRMKMLRGDNCWIWSLCALI